MLRESCAWPCQHPSPPPLVVFCCTHDGFEHPGPGPVSWLLQLFAITGYRYWRHICISDNIRRTTHYQPHTHSSSFRRGRLAHCNILGPRPRFQRSVLGCTGPGLWFSTSSRLACQSASWRPFRLCNIICENLDLPDHSYTDLVLQRLSDMHYQSLAFSCITFQSAEPP